MNSSLKILTLSAMLLLPLAAFAADTATSQTTPPPGATVFPCWDAMKDGKMMPMRGMWHMGMPGMAQGGMMMMNPQEVQRMQKEIEDLRKQVNDMKSKQ